MTITTNTSLTTKVMNVTPEFAKSVLDNPNNPSNRRVRNSVVRLYAADMAAGNWQLTHQGIMIGKDGVLIDGQHRLLAVVKSNSTVPMLVAYDNSVESILDRPLDLQIRRRLDEITGVERGRIAVANMAFKIINSRHASAHELKGLSAQLTEYDELVTPGATKPFYGAPVRLAAMIQLHINPTATGYVSHTYACLQRNDPKELAPFPYSFYRQHVGEPCPQLTLFRRALLAFDINNCAKAKFQIRHEDRLQNWARGLTIEAYGKLVMQPESQAAEVTQ